MTHLTGKTQSTSTGQNGGSTQIGAAVEEPKAQPDVEYSCSFLNERLLEGAAPA